MIEGQKDGETRGDTLSRHASELIISAVVNDIDPTSPALAQAAKAFGDKVPEGMLINKLTKMLAAGEIMQTADGYAVSEAMQVDTANIATIGATIKTLHESALMMDQYARDQFKTVS